MDLFFLDWKQILLNQKPSNDLFYILDVTSLKSDRRSKNDGTIPPLELLEVIEKVRKEAKAIVLTLSEGELGDQISAEELSKKLSEIPELSVVDQALMFPEYAFSYERKFKKFPPAVPMLLTKDTNIDQISRRILVYYDLAGKEEASNFEMTQKLWGLGHPASHFSYDFAYKGTKQVHLKHWPFYSFHRQYVSSNKAWPSGTGVSLNNKIVLIDTSGIYAFGSSLSIKRRLPWLGGEDFQKSHITSGELVATYLSNIISGDYVKTPSKFSNGVWIFIGLLTVLSTATLLPVTQAFVMSISTLALYVFGGAVAFVGFSFDYDTGKVLLVGLLLQYLILSVRFATKIRNLDRQAHAKERELLEERFNNKIILKAALADSTLRAVGKVSHDIRSPLTALNVASSLLKGKISADLREIMVEAISRIENISNDLLQGYKNKNILSEAEPVFLRQSLQELTQSYLLVDERIHFSLEIGERVIVNWPLNSLLRSFSNLINNSLDAMPGLQSKPCIEIKAFDEGDHLIIRYSDNGPGIPASIIPNLFQEGATFGKENGTGLGLYQIRSDLEKWGGKIRYQENGGGARFEIILPCDLEGLEVNLSPDVVVIEGKDTLIASRLRNAGFAVQYFNDFDEAGKYLSLNSSVKYSLVSDLTLHNHEDSVFDLMSRRESHYNLGKVIIVTTLVDSEGIKNLANKKGALLLDRSSLLRMRFVRDSPKADRNEL